MPGLKFQIEGDDRKLRKTLKDLARDMDKGLTSAAGGLSVEIDKTNKKTTEAIKLVEKEERAYKRRNTEAAKLPPPRKVDMGNSAAEIAAYKTGQVGTISGGTVAGAHAEMGKLANAATAASGAQAKLTTETVKQTVATKAQGIALEDMKRRLLVFTELQQAATDPVQRAKYNQQIQATSIEIKKMENAGKQGFDSLGNAVKGSTNLFSKAITGIMRMAYLLPGIGVAGLLAFAIDPIVNFISQLDLFNKKLSETEKSQSSLNSALASSEYTTAIKQVSQLTTNVELAKKGFVSKKGVVDEYNSTIGKTVGQVSNLDGVEKALVKSGDAYIKMTLYKAAANLALEDAAKKAFEREQTRLKAAQDFANTGDNFIAGIAAGAGGGGSQFGTSNFDSKTYAKSLRDDGEKRKQAKITQLDKEAKEDEKIAKDFQKKAAGVAGKYKFDYLGNFGSDTKHIKSEAEKAAEAIKAARKKLADELTLISLDASLSNEDATKKKISAQQDFLKSLVENGTNPASDSVTEVLDKIFELKKVLFEIDGNKFEAELFSTKTAENAKQAAAELEKVAKELEELENLPDPFRDKKDVETFADKVEKMGEKAYKVSDALYQWSYELNNVDSGLAKAILDLSNIANQVGNLSMSFKAFKAPGASGFDKVLAGAGMVGAGIGIAKSIFSMFDKSEEKRQRAAEQAQYAQQLQLKAINAQTQALQRQLDLIKDIYGAERLKAYAQGLEDIKKKQAEFTEQISTRALGNSNKLESDFIAKYNAGDRNALFLIDQKRGEMLKKQYEDIEKKRKDFDRNNIGFGQQYNLTQDEKWIQLQYHEFQKYSSIIENATKLKGKSLEELTDLMNRGLLDDQTSAIVKNLQELERQYNETLNTMRAETTGSTFSSIADEIVQMFANGTIAAEDFGKSFDAMMQKYVLNKFKGDLMAGQLQKFYEEFAERANDGLTEEEIAGTSTTQGLRDIYKNILTDAQKEFDNLTKATGVQFGGSTSTTSPNGLQGTIRRELTESTASELTGLFRGQYDVTKRLLSATSDGFAKSHDIAMGGIRHLQAIEAHTFRTANNTDLLNTKLDMVIANTKQVVTGKGLGLP